MRRHLVLTLLAGLVALACSTNGNPVDNDMGGAQPETAGEDAAAVADSAPADVPEASDVTLELPRFDAPGEIPFQECEPGTGCFLDKCEENGDCQSGWCVEHMGAGVCTESCLDECPPGWSCQQVVGTGTDVTYICVSDHANLCKPCSTGDNCKGVGGADDVCVDYGPDGSFCGGTCASDEDCPWGFSCLDSVTVDGVELKQCVADAGVCPCTDKSVTLGLWTPCAVSNEFGTCTGKRVCGADGLTACDAGQPAEETCNGIDDDCDGDVDEPAEVGGDYVNLCDDGNPCTKDTCDGEGGCLHETLDAGECVDGDSCTVGDHCEDGACVGLPIVCDDGNPCTDDLCDGQGGCKAEFNQDSCDDGDPCTVADTCSQGACVGYAVDCECQTDADCAALEDGNLCNGTLMCNQDTVPYQCEVDPATVVVCPSPEMGASICAESVCAPETGECSVAAVHEGFACDDDDACTVGDHCEAALCVSGVPAVCNDGNVCTDDSCDSEAGCLYTNNTSVCNDGNACTTGDHCESGACVGTGELACDDDNVCTVDSCDGNDGCVHAPAAGDCDDSNACTIGDHCVGGKCVFTDGIDCDDGNPCTKDSCTPAGGCDHAIIAAPCDDGDPCTINDQCINGVCQAGATLSCDDSNPCTADSCGANGTCTFEPVEAACDDNNACTLDDHCADGKCVGTQGPSCDDDNVCTTDACDPKQGCVHALNSAPCDDDDVCTTGDHCHLGECISSGALTCDDGNECTNDACNAQTGCTYTPNSAPCDDSNPCTTNDQCSAGKCQGNVVNCDDDNPCTDDFCDMGLGCIHVNNSDSCNDFDACTANEFCAGGACGGGVAVVCDDENLCTDDSCDPAKGCVFADNELPCDDSDACTDGDTCGDGACVSGAPLDCDDGNVCTDDSCDPATGCVHTPVADETPCAPEQHCMAGECVAICLYVPGTQTLSPTGSVVDFTVPDCVESLVIEVWGGQGGKNGACSQQGGKGARMKGTFVVTPGETLKVVVGERGKDRGTGTANHSGTGGGGSFVWRAAGKELLIAAGGGGGGAICTSGGSPNYATGRDGVTGTSGTSDSTNSNAGGTNGSDGGGGECRGKGWNNVQNDPSGYGSGGSQGGYGGGGTVGASHGGGGGGGYSGGGCKPYIGHPAAAGGGGGSYNLGSDQDNSDGAKTGHGQVTFTW